MEKRGSEEPGDQIVERKADDTASDASSRDLGRSLDGQANVAGGQWPDAESRPATPDFADRDGASGV
jgi:hypothetical protein